MPLFAMFTRPEGCRSTPERVGEDHTNTSGKGVSVMTETMTPSLVHQYAAMKPTEFGRNIEPKWQVAGKLVKQVQDAVEQKYLDAARWSTSHLLDHRDSVRLRRVHPARVFARSAAGWIGEPALDHKARRIERPGLRARPLFSGETTIVRAFRNHASAVRAIFVRTVRFAFSSY